MGWVTAAVAVAGLVAGAAGANAKSQAAKKAANAQVGAANQATQLQRDIYNDQRNLLEPQRIAGASATGRQMLMTGTSLQDTNAFLTRSGAPTIGSWDPQAFLQSTPGYQFRLDQGQGALDRSAAARGGLFSGRTGLETTRFAQEYASSEWDNLYRQLGDISGAGREATQTTINIGQNYGQQAAGNLRYAGNARASGYQQSGDAWGNFWEDSVPGALGTAFGGWGGK